MITLKPRKSDVTSPMNVVSNLITQKMSVISGTLAASGSWFIQRGSRTAP